MNIDVPRLLDQEVTVFSRVSAKDAGAEEDRYHVLTVSPASWYPTFSKTTDADGTVHVTRQVRVQLPASSAEYLPYDEYVQKALQGDLSGVYTLSLQDYLMLGKPTANGVLSRSEVVSEVASHDHCVVSLFRDLRNNGAVDVPQTGCLKYASVVYAEGM